MMPLARFVIVSYSSTMVDKQTNHQISLVNALRIVTLSVIIASVGLPIDQADATVSSIEIASAARPQATAPRRWVQTLTELGVANVRLRGMQSGDVPKAEDFGTEDSPLVRIVAVLNKQNDLLVPGKKLKLSDREAIKAYLERAGNDGAQSVTAARGKFGLTKEEFTTLFNQLSRPLQIPTRSKSLQSIVDANRNNLTLQISYDSNTKHVLSVNPEGLEEVTSLSRGTALAVLLGAEGLVLEPIKKPGKPVGLRIASKHEGKHAWPVGYDLEQSPRETCPKLFEQINVEIDGYTLAEAVKAISAQIEGLPIVWDRFALRSNGIIPETQQVKLARTKTFYKRIIDRLLFQARLSGDLRIDETGTPFYWVSK